MLMVMEQNLQRVLGDTNFGLPYWDWAADGTLAAAQQVTAPIWGPTAMGGQGAPVTTGPFAFRPSDATSWRVRINSRNISGTLVSSNRGLLRSFAGPDAPTLPRPSHVQNALALTPTDAPDWDASSPGFRNHLEGWKADPAESPPWLHNRVHVWVGGDMEPPSSPNDPIFFLNHCNIDRIWEGWMNSNGRTYLPPMSVGTSLRGHRIDDPIVSPLGGGGTPRTVLDVSAIYSYDALP
jgi:tyrosinase